MKTSLYENECKTTDIKPNSFLTVKEMHVLPLKLLANVFFFTSLPTARYTSIFLFFRMVTIETSWVVPLR